jgi:hypothetical protein
MAADFTIHHLYLPILEAVSQNHRLDVSGGILFCQIRAHIKSVSMIVLEPEVRCIGVLCACGHHPSVYWCYYMLARGYTIHESADIFDSDESPEVAWAWVAIQPCAMQCMRT